MLQQLHRLLRRAVFCRRGGHRETVESTGGAMLRARCVDCQHSTALGWVVPGVSNRKPHTWEHGDA